MASHPPLADLGEVMTMLFAVTRMRGQPWDASKTMEAQQEWSEHATFMNRLAADGFVVLGGPIGDEGDVLLIVNAADESKIHSTRASDPWSKLDLLPVRTIQRWTIRLQSGHGP